MGSRRTYLPTRLQIRLPASQPRNQRPLPRPLLPRPTSRTNPLGFLPTLVPTNPACWRPLWGPPSSRAPSSTRPTEWPAPRRTEGGGASGSEAARTADVLLWTRTTRLSSLLYNEPSIRFLLSTLEQFARLSRHENT